MKTLRFGIEAGADTRAAAKEFGITGIPIDVHELVADPTGVAASLDAEGLAACQISAFGFNPLHPDDAARDEFAATVRHAIPLAASMGSPAIVISGGNLHPSGFGHGDPWNFTEEALDLVAELLGPLVRAAEDDRVVISIEPYIKSAMRSPEAFLRLKDRIPSPALRMNVDVTNFYDLSDMWDPSARVSEVCRGLAGHVGLVHIKEVVLKEGFHIHIDLGPIDQGPTDWEQVIREAAAGCEDGTWLLLEHLSGLDEARRCVPILRQAAAAAGVELN